MAPDGLTYGNRVGHFAYDKELATVVDAVLNSTTLSSHLLYQAKDFNRATLLKTIKVTGRSQFQRRIQSLSWWDPLVVELLGNIYLRIGI